MSGAEFSSAEIGSAESGGAEMALVIGHWTYPYYFSVFTRRHLICFMKHLKYVYDHAKRIVNYFIK